MNPSLCFNEFTFSPIIRANQPWFKSSEIARALGYKREDFLSKLYRKNADEFTSDMTQVIENIAERRNGVLGNLSDGRCRIFSLRGCHLLAMFARTPVAKAFRKWVLDVIEQYGDRVPVEQHAFIPTPSTPADRKPLRSLVNAWAKLANVHPSTLWPQVRAHFQLERIDELPVEWLPDALAWVQEKIDEVNRRPLAVTPALPRASRFDEAPILELAAEIREAQRQHCHSFGRLCNRLITMSIPIFTALEGRIYKEAPEHPFSGTHIGAQWDRYFTDRMITALHSFEDSLPDEKNPAMLLLEYARALNGRG